METKGINILEKALKEHDGQDAIISISHKLYGLQKVKLKLDCLIDEERIGFNVKSGQEIYVYKKDLVDYGTKDGIYFADDLMKIDVKLHRQ